MSALTMLREIAVGESLYRLTCERTAIGWSVTWMQKGEERVVQHQSASLARAIEEARLLALHIEAPPVPDTEPCLPPDLEEEFAR